MVTTQRLGEVNVITTQEQVDTAKWLEDGVASDTQPKPVGFVFFRREILCFALTRGVSWSSVIVGKTTSGCHAIFLC